MSVFIILLALAGLLAILFFGLFSMARNKGDKVGAVRSQKFMRWRVVAQAGVLLLLLFGAWLSC